MNSNFKIPVGKYTQKRRTVSPVQTFEALRPENMGIGYRQSIDKKKEEDESNLERRKEINSLKARIDAMSPSEQDQIRKHLSDLVQANNTIAEINKSREAKQFRPIQRTKSVLKDLDTHDENDDIEIPSDQTGTWKTSSSKGGRGTNLHSLGRRRMRTRTRATKKMRRAKKKTTKTKRKKRRNRSIKKRR